MARARVALPLVASLALIVAVGGCSAPVAARTTAAPVYVPESIADAGRGDWETGPSAREQAYQGGTIRAASAPTVVPVRYDTTRAPTYTTTVPATFNDDIPPPPPPPPASDLSVSDLQAPPPAGATAPAPVFVGPSTSIADPCAPCPPAAAPAPISSCNLPCTEGTSMWHIRGLGGFVVYEGDDPGDNCGYWGVDFGRTFCGCWGLDVFYRWNSGTFDRATALGPAEDGGDWHHFGVKITYEGQFATNSRLFWWVGLGPEYFTTDGYDDDDSGFGVYAEAGIGYFVNRNFRIRAGVGIHGVDTDVGRENPADDGEKRWLWIIGPHIGVEVNF
ncbi:MAG: hypothetical protein QNJ98_00600 [Planctomycetota bacterium]|nr:hypothetical protein [Planctomycetota bacterium]